MPKNPTRSRQQPDRLLMPRCVSRIEAARYLGVSTGLFDREVKGGKLPAPITIGRRRVWDVKHLDAIVDAFGKLDEQSNPWDDLE